MEQKNVFIYFHNEWNNLRNISMKNPDESAAPTLSAFDVFRN